MIRAPLVAAVGLTFLTGCSLLVNDDVAQSASKEAESLVKSLIKHCDTGLLFNVEYEDEKYQFMCNKL